MKTIIAVACTVLFGITTPHAYAEDVDDLTPHAKALKANAARLGARAEGFQRELENRYIFDELRPGTVERMSELLERETEQLNDQTEQLRRRVKIRDYKARVATVARENAPVLSILDKAVASGKVRETAVAPARNLIMTGRRDPQSLKVIEATAWYCLSTSASSASERGVHLERARLAQSAVVEMMNAMATKQQPMRR
ncbi:MAG: hypothetical protein ACYC35_22745 [Pirellulales bacterium]